MTASVQVTKVDNLSIEAAAAGGPIKILEQISVSLVAGEVLGIIGESGAGKSTLGLALMGYLGRTCRVTSGGVLFADADLFRLPEAERRKFRGSRIAYVAQSAAASFNPAHRLIDQHVETAVRHGLMNASEARHAAQALYHELGLPPGIEARFPHQVSGGQLQRAMIAMAISCHPDIVIFDEPTTALDVTTQIGVLAAVRTVMQRHRLSGVYISHDLALVAQMADRIGVLRHGRLLELADTKTMLAAPKEEYTRSLWAVRKLAKPSLPADPTRPTILHAKGITVRYGQYPALQDVSFSVPHGRTVAIVGESGSGKSTLARALTGVLTPAEGSVSFEGGILATSYKDRLRDQLRRVQLIYQMADTALNPRHTVRTIIERPLKLFFRLTPADCKDRVRQLMAATNLDDTLLDRPTRSLSGGQKQRVAIARALAAEPSLLICDEVTSALDQIVAEGILKLLRDLQETRQISMIFITHDLVAARAIADEVVVMRRGRIVESGRCGDVFDAPQDPYTRNLIASVPQMDAGWLDRILGELAPPTLRE